MVSVYSWADIDFCWGEDQLSGDDSIAATEAHPCNGNVVEDDAWRSKDRTVGPKISVDIALAFLFPGCPYDEGVVTWCPANDSETSNFLFDGPYDEKVYTKLAFSARYVESDRPHFFILLQTKAVLLEECHVCNVLLGGAIFLKKAGSWQLKVFNPAIMKAGCWGTAPTDIKIVRIGTNTHGVEIHDGYMAMGFYSESGSISIQSLLVSCPVFCVASSGEYPDMHRLTRLECGTISSAIRGNLFFPRP